jgi:maltose/moltooligosaccharide transporter
MQKKQLGFWDIWNMSFGFLGIQMGFALQNGNASRILQNFGADVHELSWFWLVAPLTGMIVQPIIGYYSDRTWNRLGRRKPYFLAGTIICCLALIVLPNSGGWFTAKSALMIGAGMLMLMDASINVAMEPFRALVADNLPDNQRTYGFTVQTFLIGVGAVVGSWLPWFLTTYCGIANEAPEGQAPDNVIYSFYIGAIVFIVTILITIWKTKEYNPQEYEAIHGKPEESHVGLSQIFKDFAKMPATMRQLGLVQFFTWFALFSMWVFTTPALTREKYNTYVQPDVMVQYEAGIANEPDAAKREDFAKMIAESRESMDTKKGLYVDNRIASYFSSDGLIPETSLIQWMQENQIANSFDKEHEELKKDFDKVLASRTDNIKNNEKFISYEMLEYVYAQKKSEMDAAFGPQMQLLMTSRNIVNEHNKGGDWVGILFGVYNGISALFALLLPSLAVWLGRKRTHAFSLIAGGLGLISIFLIDNPNMLMLSMVGIGIAWASILAMPYAILAGSIPAGKMGVYMGIFNFFITLPQIINGIIGGLIVQHLYAGRAIYALILAGVLMLCAAITVLYVKENNVIRMDRDAG